MIKAILKDMNLDEKRFPLAALQNAISNAKNEMLDAAAFAKLAGDFFEQKAAEVYEQYEKRLAVNNALDFDDLLMVTVKILTEYPEIREKYQKRFNYIMIDEYQDTNRTQYLLARYLAGDTGNLCAVGDADQSIYGWRGADIRNILDFEKDYPGARLLKLEQNYRSTVKILDAANAVIENNTGRKPKNYGQKIRKVLFLPITMRQMSGMKPVLLWNRRRPCCVIKITVTAIWPFYIGQIPSPVCLKKC